jgi:lipopolysaccharide export system permease protein
LQGYILSQLGVPLLGACLGINLLLLVLQLLKAGEIAFGAGLGLGELGSLALLGLPSLAVLSVPVAVLIGVLLALGRMAEDRELVALAAAGIPLRRILPMPLGVGLVAAGLGLALSGWAAPSAQRALHAALVELAKRQVVAALVPGRFFEEIPRVVLYPARAGSGPGAFEGFLLYDHRPGKLRHLLLAERAEILPAPGADALRLELQDGEVHIRDGRDASYTVARFARAGIALDIERLIHDRTRVLSPLDRMGLDELERGAGDPAVADKDRRRMRAAWHRRLAYPSASVLFAGLAAVLVAAGRLRGRRRTLLAAAVVVTAYYLLMRLGDSLVDQAVLPPPLAAWAPALVLAGLVLAWAAWASRRPG